MKLILGCVLTLLLLSGCTVINVSPVKSNTNLTDVCIEKNPNVHIKGFIEAVQSGFERHGVNTRAVDRPVPENCENILSYTALETWDIVFYMHHAALRLEHKGNLLGTAEYHLRGGGGFSLLKYQSPKTKLDPVIDQLLSSQQKQLTRK